MQSYNELLITVHPQLLDSGSGTATKRGFGNVRELGLCGAVEMWALARGIDQNGSGWAAVEIDEAALLFDCHRNTIIRKLKTGVSLQIFRSVRFKPYNGRKNGLAIVYYTSVHNVACLMGMTQLPSSWVVPASTLIDSKTLATSLKAYELQRQSFYLKTREILESKAPDQEVQTRLRNIVQPSLLITESFVNTTAFSSATCREITDRRAYLWHDAEMTGGSQLTIAARLGRNSDRQIRRRLSNDRLQNTYRGLIPEGMPMKLQMVKHVKTEAEKLGKKAIDEMKPYMSVRELYAEPASEREGVPLYKKDGKFFEPYCNGYTEANDLEYRIQRMQRKRYKQRVKTEGFWLEPVYGAVSQDETQQCYKVNMTWETSEKSENENGSHSYVKTAETTSCHLETQPPTSSIKPFIRSTWFENENRSHFKADAAIKGCESLWGVLKANLGILASSVKQVAKDLFEAHLAFDEHNHATLGNYDEYINLALGLESFIEEPLESAPKEESHGGNAGLVCKGIDEFFTYCYSEALEVLELV